jgi:phytanoyl-CoA hydroxylase
VRDDIFRAFVHQPKIARAVKSLGYRNPEIPQTMFIFKQPFIGGEVTTHQVSARPFVKHPTPPPFFFSLPLFQALLR